MSNNCCEKCEIHLPYKESNEYQCNNKDCPCHENKSGHAACICIQRGNFIDQTKCPVHGSTPTPEKWEEAFDERFESWDAQSEDTAPTHRPLEYRQAENIKSFIRSLLKAKEEEIEKKVEGELDIHKTVQEKARDIFVIGKKKSLAMLEDVSVRKGKIEALSNVLDIIRGKEKS